MQYAKYLEQHSIEGVRNVYRRACEIHLPKKPYIHLAWAAFEERQGILAVLYIISELRKVELTWFAKKTFKTVMTYVCYMTFSDTRRRCQLGYF